MGRVHPGGWGQCCRSHRWWWPGGGRSWSGDGPGGPRPGLPGAGTRHLAKGSRWDPAKGLCPQQISSLFLCLVMEYHKESFQNVIEKNRAAKTAMDSEVRQTVRDARPGAHLDRGRPHSGGQRGTGGGAGTTGARAHFF